MDQGPNIYRAAEIAVERLGAGAYSYLCERAELAKLAGDRVECDHLVGHRPGDDRGAKAAPRHLERGRVPVL